MADSADFKIVGIDSLIGKLKNISYDMKYKGGRAALRAGANVVVEAAKAKAQRVDDPKTRESISKNIVARWNRKLFKQTGDLGFRIGVLGGALKSENTANPGGDTYYWRFVEFGTSKIPAAPFLRPALSENIEKVTRTFILGYEKSIDRAIKRAQKAGVK